MDQEKGYPKSLFRHRVSFYLNNPRYSSVVRYERSSMSFTNVFTKKDEMRSLQGVISSKTNGNVTSLASRWNLEQPLRLFAVYTQLASLPIEDGGVMDA